MNAAHFHLVLNHIPVVSIPIALVLVLAANRLKNEQMLQFTYLFAFVAALLVLPAMWTGEPAEEMIEHLPGIQESFIEQHEDAASLSLALSLVTGALAGSALFMGSRPVAKKALYYGVLVSGTLASASLIRAANLGGTIRHSEIRSESAAAETATDSSGHTSHEESDDDDD